MMCVHRNKTKKIFFFVSLLYMIIYTNIESIITFDIDVMLINLSRKNGNRRNFQKNQ